MGDRTRWPLAVLLTATALTAAGIGLGPEAAPIALLSLFAVVVWAIWRLARVDRALDRLKQRLETLHPGDPFPSLPPELSPLNQTLRRIWQRYEDTLQTQQARLAQGQAMVRRMGDGLILVASDGRITDLNPMAERLFGVTANQARGRTLAQGVQHHRLVALWRTCQESQSEQRDLFEIPYTGHLVQVIATPLDTSTPPQVMLLIQDLTRVHRLETIRRDFVANLSHELRTPLAALQALTETLQSGALEDPQAARRFLRRMAEEVAALTRLVQDLLDLTRLESGRLSLRLSPQSPQELLAQAAERAALAAQEAGVTLHLQPGEGLPPVLADRQRILQVLANLLDNAIRFTPPGGTITLGATATDHGVQFWVQDTGIGIPAEHLPRIFERFYKVDAARQRRGTGLGLAIAKHIVEAHQGRIGAESRVGQGSRFWFLLPKGV